MKIGIMSMQRIINYGSLMQAYALKKMIESLGHQVVFVDYHIAPTIYKRKSIKAKVKCLFKNCIKMHLPGTKVEYFLKFIFHKNSDHKQVFYSFYKRLGLPYKYRYRESVDVLVIGSDEVFNCLQKGETVGYSLELFGKNNRAHKVITYAASFGSTTISGLKKYGVSNEICECLKKISQLSVRDQNSIDIINELTGTRPLFHLDPVIVGNLEEEKWDACKEKNFMILYGYYRRFTLKECQEIMDYSHLNGLKVIALGEEQELYDAFVACKPDELLSYFKKANFVITDTFHGTIFSIICHKRFITIPRHSINGTGGNIEKIESLLKVFNLTDRACYTLDKIEMILNTNIDYEYIDLIRNRERERTMRYLSDNLTMNL